MLDATTILNPDLKSPELRAFAYLSARYSEGVRSSVDCLLPFVTYAVSFQAGNQFDLKTEQSYLKSNYRINIPYYMVERMIPELRQLGALEKTGIGRVLICRDVSTKIDSIGTGFSIDQIDQTEAALAAFALERGYASPATADKWNDLLIPFFQSTPPPKNKAASTIQGKLISDPASIDYTIIAEFIMHQFSIRSQIYKTIEKVYYGVIVAEFLTHVESVGSKTSYRGLVVIYDGPVILRLLGCSGSILKIATEELHDTLREMGCSTYYFQHTYDEVLNSIEGIISAYENKRPMFRETNEAIARGELKISDVYTIRSELDYRLSAQLGLTAHSKSYEDRREDDYQIDEAAFKETLRGERGWGAVGSSAADKDAKSLALTVRLRGGKQNRDISKSRHIFVTHNSALARKAKRFLVESGDLAERSVSPVLTVGQMSTVAWVANEVFQDSARIIKELIANCYAAALPDENFDQKLKEKLVSVDPKAAAALYTNAFLVESVREIALQRTSGHSTLIDVLNTAEIIALAEDHKNQAINLARNEERSKVIDELNQEIAVEKQAKIDRAAENIAYYISLALAIICSVISLYAVALFGLVSGKINYPIGVILGVIGVWGILDRFKVLGSFSLQKTLVRLIAPALSKIQSVLT